MKILLNKSKEHLARKDITRLFNISIETVKRWECKGLDQLGRLEASNGIVLYSAYDLWEYLFKNKDLIKAEKLKTSGYVNPEYMPF